MNKQEILLYIYDLKSTFLDLKKDVDYSKCSQQLEEAIRTTIKPNVDDFKETVDKAFLDLEHLELNIAPIFNFIGGVQSVKDIGTHMYLVGKYRYNIYLESLLDIVIERIEELQDYYLKV